MAIKSIHGMFLVVFVFHGTVVIQNIHQNSFKNQISSNLVHSIQFRCLIILKFNRERHHHYRDLSRILKPIGPLRDNPNNKVHGANMGPTWVLLAPDGPHGDPMNLAISGKLWAKYASGESTWRCVLQGYPTLQQGPRLIFCSTIPVLHTSLSWSGPSKQVLNDCHWD